MRFAILLSALLIAAQIHKLSGKLEPMLSEELVNYTWWVLIISALVDFIEWLANTSRGRRD